LYEHSKDPDLKCEKGKNKIPLNYIILEYADGYDNFNLDDDEEKLQYSLEGACKLYIHIIKMLLFLNDSLGFNHWDFHPDNILVKNKDEFKLFDFDQSSTDKNKNDCIFDRIFKDVNKNDSKKLGVLYDIYRLMESITNNFYNNLTLSKILKNSKYASFVKIIEELYPDFQLMVEKSESIEDMKKYQKENVLKWYEAGYYDRIKWEIGYGCGDEEKQIEKEEQTEVKKKQRQTGGNSTYRHKYKKYKYKYDMLLKQNHQ